MTILTYLSYMIRIMTQNIIQLDCIHRTCQSGSIRVRSKFCTPVAEFLSRLWPSLKTRKWLEPELNLNRYTYTFRLKSEIVLALMSWMCSSPSSANVHSTWKCQHFQTRKFLIIKQTPDVCQTWTFPLEFLMTKSETSQFPEWGWLKPETET